jgi:hypothetical protein
MCRPRFNYYVIASEERASQSLRARRTTIWITYRVEIATLRSQ